MKKYAALFALFFLGFAVVAYASSKISDDGYRLLRELMTYKNHEIEMLRESNAYAFECLNVTEADSNAHKCAARMTELQDRDRELQVKHDVFAHELQAHLRQHKDDEWLFMGLMADDKEFSNLAH